MAKKEKGTDPNSKYLAEFKKHFDEVDELTQSVLKGHLIMEGAIDNILSLMFFHPELAQRARLRFGQKVEIVRAYALQEHNNSIWKLVAAISELRNEIAHKLEGPRREEKIGRLKELYFSELEGADRQKKYPDHLIVIMACSLCTGFLGRMEEDIAALRRMLDKMAAMAPKKG